MIFIFSSIELYVIKFFAFRKLLTLKNFLKLFSYSVNSFPIANGIQSFLLCNYKIEIKLPLPKYCKIKLKKLIYTLSTK